MKRLLVLGTMAMLFLVILATLSPTQAEASKPDHPTPESALAAVRWISETNARLTWYFGVEAQRQLDEQRARARPRGSAPASYDGIGECTGFVIPDRIIQRESNGQSGVWNTEGSGAFGCAQTLITHYQTGQCSQFDRQGRGAVDPYTIEGQRECVDRLSNHGTNLAPWGE